MYFDTAYIAKCYCNEPDSPAVRALLDNNAPVHSSLLALVEFRSVLHRHMRQGLLTRNQARVLSEEFRFQIESGVWKLIPATETLLHQTSAELLGAPRNLFLRAIDAVHLQSAKDLGEKEIWTSDRHMLAAAPHFGLKGRSV